MASRRSTATAVFLALTASALTLVAPPAALAAGDCNGTALGEPAIDVNDDGCSDAVVGVPGRTVGGKRGAGAIEIELGSVETPLHGGSIRVVLAAPRAGDHFGAAVTTTDLDGDGITDVVIGVPGRDVSGKTDAGAVGVLLGSDAIDGPVTLGADALRAAEEPNSAARFGAALAVAPASGLQTVRVFVGAPGTLVGGAAGAGLVAEYTGTTLAGTTSDAPVIHTQETDDIPGDPDEGDHFGAALAFMPDTGNLYIGVPGEPLHGLPQSGVVDYILGGIGTSGELSQDAENDENLPERGDKFGEVLCACGDSLVVGVPHEDIRKKVDAGIAEEFTDRSLQVPVYWRRLDQRRYEEVEAGDRFGAALALVGRFNSGRKFCSGVVVGVPGEDIDDHKNAGLVWCEFHADPSNLWAGHGLPGKPTSGARLGASIVGAEIGQWTDRGVTADPRYVSIQVPVIGVPGAAHGRGAVIADVKWRAQTWHLSGTPAAGDHFGAVIA